MRICIDAGHGYANRRAGSYDPGATAAGLAEADITLQWALTLKWVLARAGVPVWLTRDDDRDPAPVATRDDRAEQARCTHLLSIHCNAGGNGKRSGVETFFRDETDRRWAAVVHEAAVRGIGLPDRGVRPEAATAVGRLAVFDFAGPACLVELGYIDSAADRRALTSRARRIAFAEDLAEAIRAVRG